VNGNWGSWGQIGACNKPCGGGHRYRYRSCNNPAPAHGGKACSGTKTHVISCNLHHCPGKKFEFTVSRWLYIFIYKLK